MSSTTALGRQRSGTTVRLSGLAVVAFLFCALSIELLFFYVQKLSVGGMQVRYLLTTVLATAALGGLFVSAPRQASFTISFFHLKLAAVVGLLVFNAVGVALLLGNFSPATAVILLIQPGVFFFSLVALFRARPLRLLGTVLAVCSTSSVVAVLQAFDFTPAWQLHGFFAEGIPTGYRLYGRVAGLTADPVRLSYIALLGAGVALGLIHAGQGPRRLLLAMLAINGAATILSGTRSAALALVAILVLSAFARVRKSDRLAVAALLGIGLLVAYPAFTFITQFGDGDLTSRDFSSMSRSVLLEAALHQIAATPLGIGFGSFADAAVNLDIYWDEYAQVARQAIGTFEPHNYLVNFAVYYGLQGLFLILAFYYLLFRAAWRASKDGRPSVVAAGWVALYCLVSFVVNVLVHNSGPFNGDTSLLTVAAAVVAVQGRRVARPDP